MRDSGVASNYLDIISMLQKTTHALVLTVCGTALVCFLAYYFLIKTKMFVKITKNAPFIVVNAAFLPVVLLFYTCAVSIAASVSRVPIDIIHPYFAGPRYFFYPFILLSWILIFILHDSKNKIVKATLIVVLFSFIFGGQIKNMSRSHFYIDWRSNIVKCLRNNGTYIFPVQLDGYNEPWTDCSYNFNRVRDAD
jgi:hypothetical protein